jgi:hypothetical protein
MAPWTDTSSQGSCDGDALPLSAGEPARGVRCPVGVQVDELEEAGDLDGSRPPTEPVGQGFCDALPDTHPRVQRRERILEDHLERPVTSLVPDGLSVEQDASAVQRREPDRRSGERRLP